MSDTPAASRSGNALLWFPLASLLFTALYSLVFWSGGMAVQAAVYKGLCWGIGTVAGFVCLVPAVFLIAVASIAIAGALVSASRKK